MSSLVRASRVVLALKGNFGARAKLVNQNVGTFSNECRVWQQLSAPSSLQAVNGLMQIQTRSNYGRASVRQSYGRNSNSIDNKLEMLDREVIRTGTLHRFRLNEVINQVKTTDSIAASQAQLLIRCFGDKLVDVSPENRVKDVHDLMGILKEKGVNLDISHHNALLSVYLENDFQFCPVEYLASLGDIRPNRITYQRLLYRYCQMGDIEGALKILSHMKEENLTISQSVFESLIMGHGRAGDIPAASDMLQHMASSGFEPSADSYTMLAIAQAEAGDVDGVRDTLSKAQVAEQSLSDYHLLEVIYAFASKGHSDHVDKMIELLQRGSYYNRDCKLVILKLINSGYMEAAEKLYSTMVPLATGNPDYNKSGLFYLRQMIACGRPVSEVLSSPVAADCQHPQKLSVLLESALLARRASAAAAVMDALVATGGELRAHYFWPSLVAAGESGVTEMCAVLKDIKERGVPLNIRTFQEYIIPMFMKENKMSDTEIIDFLKEKSGIAPSLTFNELLRNLLFKGSFERATDLIGNNQIWVNLSLYSPLVTAVSRSQDYESGAKVLSNIRDNQQEIVEDIAGRYLNDLARRAQKGNMKLDADTAVKSVHSRGLSIAAESLQNFTSLLPNPVTAETEALLKAMASGELELIDDMDNRPKHQGGKASANNKERSLKYLESKASQMVEENGTNSSGFHVLLLRKYIDENDVLKAEELWGKMFSDILSFKNATSLQVSMLNLYTNNGNLEKAVAQLKEIHATSPPDAAIDRVKVVRLALLMVDRGMSEDALSLLESEGIKYDVNERKGRDAQRLDHFTGLLAAAVVSATGDAQLLDRFTASLLKHGYAKPTPRLLRPRVGMHMGLQYVPRSTDLEQSDEAGEESEDKTLLHPAFGDSWDLEPAYQAFMKIATEHGVMPYKTAILRRLIRAEDKEKLQEVLNISAKLSGDTHSLFDLACAFLEEDKKRQAVKILQNPYIRIPSATIVGKFDFYLKQDESAERMEKLLELTGHIRGVDRRPFFSKLLHAYDKQGDHAKALDLWSRMQEENVTPSNQFMSELAQVLKKHGQPVPFHEPTEVPRSAPPSFPNSFTEQRRRLKKPTKKVLSEATTKMHKLLDENKIDEAVEFYRSGPADLDVSPVVLVSKLRFQGRLKEAADLLVEALRSSKDSPFTIGTSPDSACGILISELSKAGEYELIKDLMQQFSALRGMKSSRLLCEATRTSEQRRDCLDTLKNWPEKTSVLGLGVIVGEEPELFPLVQEMTDKYASDGQTDAFEHMAWAHKFCRGETTQTPEHVQLRYPLTIMRRSQDVSVAAKLLELPQIAGDKEACAQVYGAWTSVLLRGGQTAEAAQVLQSALKSVELRPGLLNAVRTACEKEGLKHNIPEPVPVQKRNESSSSSSSSDKK